MFMEISFLELMFIIGRLGNSVNFVFPYIIRQTDPMTHAGTSEN